MENNTDFRSLYASDEDQYYYFIKNPKFQNPLSVDSLVTVHPDDFIFYGDFNQWTKKFQVNNTILESNKEEIVFQNTQAIKRVSDQKPYHKKVSYNYLKDGLLYQQVDSCFLKGKLVFVQKSEITYSTGSVPKRIQVSRKSKHQEWNLQNQINITYK